MSLQAPEDCLAMNPTPEGLIPDALAVAIEKAKRTVAAGGTDPVRISCNLPAPLVDRLDRCARLSETRRVDLIRMAIEAMLRVFETSVGLPDPDERTDHGRDE